MLELPDRMAIPDADGIVARLPVKQIDGFQRRLEQNVRLFA